MKLTEEQVNQILYEDCVYDGGNELYEVVHWKITDNDSEKNSVRKEFVICENATGKFFKASLGESPWNGQSAANAKEEWEEVKQKKVTKITYVKKWVAIIE